MNETETETWHDCWQSPPPPPLCACWQQLLASREQARTCHQALSSMTPSHAHTLHVREGLLHTLTHIYDVDSFRTHCCTYLCAFIHVRAHTRVRVQTDTQIYADTHAPARESWTPVRGYLDRLFCPRVRKHMHTP